MPRRYCLIAGKGEHSIRIDDQYRICFRWTDSGPDTVRVEDYH
jgi:proteic killer suppression protein